MEQEFEYVCEHCGEQIVAPLDLSAGQDQEFVEDCPVCCSPNVIHVRIDGRGRVTVSSQSEQDLY
jgi:DNA-directed RNA polymerase subunit RPC12/RpoP